MPLPPKTDVLGRENAAHLLRRAAFGFDKADIDRFATMTPQQAVAELFASGNAFDLPNPAPPLEPTATESWITQPAGDQDENDLRGYFLRWTEGQMLSPNVPNDIKLPYSVRERIVFFLHTHFTTKQDKVGRSKSLYYQNALFRFFAFDKLAPEFWVPEPLVFSAPITDEQQAQLDRNQRQIAARKIENINFKSLSEKICLDNAMLRFLDGNQNVKNNPNENYGREFLELYTRGKGLEGSVDLSSLDPGDYFTFTEDDVKAATRVFTGYEIDDTYTNEDDLTGLPIVTFNQDRHDEEAKAFTNRLDDAVIAKSVFDTDSPEEIERKALDEIKQLVDIVFSNRESARYICRKVYRFYVHGMIDDGSQPGGANVENTIIEQMATTFIDSGFKLQALLEELFQSTYFYGENDDRSNIGALIKSPLDMMSSIFNALNVSLPNHQTEAEAFYEKMEAIRPRLLTMGMDFYEPFEVAGYTAYHQFPSYTRSWISTTYLTNRYNFIRQVVSDEDFLAFDVVDFIESNFDNTIAENAESLVIALCELFLPLSQNLTFDQNLPEGDLTLSRLKFFLSALLDEVPSNAGEEPGAAWTRYWGQKDPLIVGALQRLLSSVLESPEYQLF